MKENKEKRYLVTYVEPEISTSKASGILGVSKSDCKDGVSFMETDATPSKKDVLHFKNVGISSIELSDEELSKLSKKKEILAVEEDIEMHVLELTNEEEQAEFLNSTLFENDENDGHAYQEGYHHALVDLFSSMLILGSKGNISVNGNGNGYHTAIPFPPGSIRPIQPFPKLPFPPIKLPKQPTPWNISMVKAPEAWKRGLKGNGVNVAILDTGIASHTDLSIAGGVSFISGVTSYNDGHSHGTHCAGIVGARNNILGVVGVAPLCNLYAVKVLSDAGSGPSSGVIAGMDWCITNGIQVASMSLGSSSAPSVAYASAVKRCQNNGVTVVVATGNSGLSSSFPYVGAPANSYERGTSKASPIAVGSIDQNSTIAGSSSRGGEHPEWNEVTVVAPGVSIKSTVLNNAYGTKSGTSMACPHVAGLAALIYEQYPGISPVNVERRITSTASDLGGPGYDTPYGYGLINCDRATA